MTQPLRLLLVIDSFGAGGAQNQLSLLAAGLANRGHEIHTYQYHPDDSFGHRLTEAGVTRHIAPAKLPWQRILYLRKLLKKFSFDLVLAYMDKPGLIATIATYGLDVKTIISHRSVTRWHELSPVERQLRLWTNRRATAIICNSNHERHFWQKRVPHAHIDTIWNGLPEAGHDQREDDQIPLPAQSDDNRKIFLIIGTVCRYKNLHTVISALHQLSSQHFALPTIWCAGEPKNSEPDDQLYKQELIDALDSYGLEDHWIWLGHRNNPQPLYDRAYALIHASTTEGLPNVVCEAQMSGLPVIASNVLDHPLMITDGENGILFNIDSQPSLAEAMTIMLNAGYRHHLQMKHSALAHAKSHYSLDHFIKMHETIFYSLRRP